MALFIKPSSFFLKFFALTLVFQVSVSAQKLLADSPEHTPTPSASVENKSENKDLPADFENLPVGWIERSISVMTTNNGTESERKYFIFCDVKPSIDAAGQTSTASTYYIYARNSDQKIPEELQNLIQPVDPVENAESPNPQTDPQDLLQLINLNLLTIGEQPPIFILQVISLNHLKIEENPPIFIPNIPPRILNGATYQGAVPGEGKKDLIIILESAQGYQHNATFTLNSKDNYSLVRLSGQLPSGTAYILTAPEPLIKADEADEADEADNEKLDQLRQQRDKQEENNNHPESTDGSSDD